MKHNDATADDVLHANQGLRGWLGFLNSTAADSGGGAAATGGSGSGGGSVSSPSSNTLKPSAHTASPHLHSAPPSATAASAGSGVQATAGAGATVDSLGRRGSHVPFFFSSSAPASEKDQKFIEYTPLSETFYRDAAKAYMHSKSSGTRKPIPKNMIVMEAEAVKAAVGPALLSLRAHEHQLKDAEAALSQLPQDADIQNKTALEFEIQNIQKRVENGKKDVEDAATRYEKLRPDVMEVVGEALHQDCLSYEAALAKTDPAVRDQITAKAAEVSNAGPLERGEEVQIVAPGPRYERAQVVQESGERPGHWELLVWDEQDNLGREYSAGFDTKRTVPRTEIYANSSYEQVVRLPDGSTDGVPATHRPEYILLLMQTAEETKAGFDDVCADVCKRACEMLGGDKRIEAVFSRLKSLDRITKKGADKYRRNYKKVLDVVRMTFVCHDIHGALAALTCLSNAKGLRLIRVKNRMHPAFDHRNSTTAGYHGDLLW